MVVGGAPETNETHVKDVAMGNDLFFTEIFKPGLNSKLVNYSGP
jgi:hypothetical protein